MAEERLVRKRDPHEEKDVNRDELAHELGQMARDITAIKGLADRDRSAGSRTQLMERADEARERVRTLARMVGVEY